MCVCHFLSDETINWTNIVFTKIVPAVDWILIIGDIGLPPFTLYLLPLALRPSAWLHMRVWPAPGRSVDRAATIYGWEAGNES